MVTRIPLGTWETLPSPSCLPVGARLTNSRLILGMPSRAVRTNRGRNDGIAKRRKRSAAKQIETDVRESENLVVPLTQGNQPEGPWRGKGMPSHAPLTGHMAGTQRP